jgi:SAM-dependent methyltransferase
MVKFKIYVILINKIIKNYTFQRVLNFFINYFKIIKLVSRSFNDLDMNQYKNAGESFEKYLDYKYWVLENLVRVYDLNIDKNKNLKILDIGTGFGYFPFICQYFGHHSEAIDLDNNKMYNHIIKLLDINRHSYQIDSYKPLPINTKFDIITGFMICFNNHKTENLWGFNEWQFFLDSLQYNNLNKTGILFFSFNLEYDGRPFSLEIKNLFMKRKAIIKNHEVLFNIN